MLRWIILLSLLASPAFAQQAPLGNPAELQMTLGIIENQRNAVLSEAARLAARAEMLMAENAKLKAEILELKKKAEPAADK